MGPRTFISSIVLLAVLHSAHSEDWKIAISKGDQVNLTVNLTVNNETDSAYKLTWYFRDDIYTDGETPPHVIFNQTTMQAYINTSALNTMEYDSIFGTYTRELDYDNERKNVSIAVVRKGGSMSTTKPNPSTPAASAGFEITWWMYATLAAVVVVIVIVVVVAIVIIRRRRKKASLAEEKTREKMSYKSVSVTETN